MPARARQNIEVALALWCLLLLTAVAGRTQTLSPQRLTLREAIQRGLKANLRTLSSATRIDEAQRARQRRLATLLPRLRGEALANLQNRNLRAFGISFPGTPEVVGPFSNYDFRLYGEQPLVDLQSYHNWKASEQQEHAAREEYQDVRYLVIRQIAALYLNAQAAVARVTAGESRVATAEALDRLARERREAGVATGVDVLRAQVQLANEQQRLLEARNAARQALLLLARNIGLSPGTPLELSDLLQFQSLEPPEITAVLESSLSDRADYRSLRAQREVLVEQRKATRARYLPRLGLAGNFGGIGRSIGQVRATGLLQGTISLTLFDWDRRGEQQEIESRLRRLDHQLADLRLGIEQEIREALLQLQSAAEEVQVAEQGRGLAERELELARERFQTGVAANIEVVSAQDALARAQENYIVAVTRHSDAKIALARALGATEQIYERYLGVQ